MELQHFSHPHPLVLAEEHETEQYCPGCMQPIMGPTPTYICSDTECSFMLHQKCAEMPKELNHPAHAEHALTLLCEPYVTYNCASCFDRSGVFFYNCDLCDFCLDLPCATSPDTIEHVGHTHPLSLQLKPSLFCCDACGKTHDIQGRSYQCAACNFWVHHECVSLPETVEHKSHDHPLTLSNCSQLEFAKFKIYCDICSEVVKQRNSVYCCGECRFVAHVGCANAENDEDEGGDSNEIDESNVVSLPMEDESVDLTNHLLEQFSKPDEAKEIDHEHPLTLFEEYEGIIIPANGVKGDEMCNACFQPVSAPYYGCSECDFLLHKCCAELPDEIQHPLHPEHAFTLLTRCNVECNCCGTLCNGYAYMCRECPFYLDARCASFPPAIKHEGHQHPLVFENDPGRARCKACQQPFFSGYSLKCASSCNFSIHIDCASLPRGVTYRDGTYALIPTYPPEGNHSEEYFCQICEGEVNPKNWFYYAADTNVSFHAGCVTNLVNGIPNFKFMAINDGVIHEHPLTFVRKTKDHPLPCDRCGKPCDGLAFQCKEDDYILDFDCASELGALSF